MSLGAKRPSPKKETRAGAFAFAYSSSKITCCANVSARPPYSSGHDIPTQRSAPSTRSHSIRTSQPVSSAGPPDEPSAANSPVRCSASQACTSARKAASSGVSRKSMAAGPLLDRPVEFLGSHSAEGRSRPVGSYDRRPVTLTPELTDAVLERLGLAERPPLDLAGL